MPRYALLRAFLFLAFAALMGCECAPGVIPTPENQCIPRATGGGDGGANPPDVSTLREGDFVQRRSSGPTTAFADGGNRSTVYMVVGGRLRMFIQQYPFFTWRPSFEGIRRDWDDAVFESFTRSTRRMTVRPATLVLMPLAEVGVVPLDSKYVVERCNVLRRVTNDQLRNLYGERGVTGATMGPFAATDVGMVQFLTAETWRDYTVGDPLPVGEYPVGQLLLDDAGRMSVITAPGNRARALTDEVARQNGFDRAFAVRIPATIHLSFEEGASYYLPGRDPALAAPCGD